MEMDDMYADMAKHIELQTSMTTVTPQISPISNSTS